MPLSAPANNYHSPEAYLARATQALAEALAEAYPSGAPEGAMDLLTAQKKPGTVCAIFYSGRSGSYLAQSFFDREMHPQVLTVNPPALERFDGSISAANIAQFNDGSLKRDLPNFVTELLRVFPFLCGKLADQAGLDDLIAPHKLFGKFLYAQLMCIEPGNMTHEELLKIIFLAYRFSRGGQLQCRERLIYLWQAHIPEPRRKQWVLEQCDKPYLLTAARFPEKSFDSHLVHHAFGEILEQQLVLFRDLLFWRMCVGNEVIGTNAGRQGALRFEDVHHNTAFVLEKLCEWWKIPYLPNLHKNAGTLYVRGQKISGVRPLTSQEFECKLLNYYDRIKLRFLMREEYQQWGYDRFCQPSLEESLSEYRLHEPLRNMPFATPMALGLRAGIPMETIMQEMKELDFTYERERKRRDKGIQVLPLLYNLDDLPKKGSYTA
jgi:hypothetical protein